MKRALALLPLLLLAACGGGTRPCAPPVLTYADPSPGGFRWVRNPDLSTSRLVVLDLEGPGPAAAGRGVVFKLRADPAASRWVEVSGQGRVQNLAFDLGAGTPLMRSNLDGGVLQAGIFQKGRGNAAPLEGPLCRVAIEALDGLPAGRAIELEVLATQMLPAAGAALQDQPCKVGVLAWD